MTGSLGLIVEGLVALLLLASIVYSLILNRKLDRLRADQSGMVKLIGELNKATFKADNAIKGLGLTVRQAEGELARRIETGSGLAAELADRLEKAQNVMSQISAIYNEIKTSENSRQHNVNYLPLDKELRRRKMGFADSNKETAL
jgi:hypothetical protein